MSQDYKKYNILLEDIKTIKTIYNKGIENYGDDFNNIYNKRFNKENYNTNIVNAKTFFCDLHNNELIEIIKKYIVIHPDEYISNVHYINYGINDEAKPHVDSIASIRTYIIMLNDEFTGGEFFLDKKIVPFKLGEMIEFDANMTHGVKKIIDGNREVLVIWMNFNKKDIKTLM